MVLTSYTDKTRQSSRCPSSLLNQSHSKSSVQLIPLDKHVCHLSYYICCRTSYSPVFLDRKPGRRKSDDARSEIMVQSFVPLVLGKLSPLPSVALPACSSGVNNLTGRFH